MRRAFGLSILASYSFVEDPLARRLGTGAFRCPGSTVVVACRSTISDIDLLELLQQRSGRLRRMVISLIRAFRRPGVHD
jgi:hypothetical protein